MIESFHVGRLLSTRDDSPINGSLSLTVDFFEPLTLRIIRGIQQSNSPINICNVCRTGWSKYSEFFKSRQFLTHCMSWYFVKIEFSEPETIVPATTIDVWKKCGVVVSNESSLANHCFSVMHVQRNQTSRRALEFGIQHCLWETVHMGNKEPACGDRYNLRPLMLFVKRGSTNFHHVLYYTLFILNWTFLHKIKLVDAYIFL